MLYPAELWAPIFFMLRSGAFPGRAADLRNAFSVTGGHCTHFAEYVNRIQPQKNLLTTEK
jgi:hypothetical protein